MKSNKFSRLTQSTLFGVLGLLVITGCTQSTSNNTNASKQSNVEPMAAPAPRSHSDESVSYYNQATPPAPQTSTLTASATTTVPATTTPYAAKNTLSPYVKSTAIRGRLRSIGSDTMDRMMYAWEKDFKNYHQGIRVIHEGKGTSTAIPGLVEGRSDFGPMSRSVKPAELKKFEAQFGYPPTSMPVAIDALAVYVHPDNPIKDRGLSMSEVDAIFSSTRRRGHSEDIVTWGDLGLTGAWANKPINVYSRNKASGTYGFFKDEALKKGDFKTTNRELPGSEDVVRSVENDPYGIGFSGFGYNTPGVATVPLSDGGTMIEANQANAVSGTYPLSRNLYMVINQIPGEPTKALHAEFIRYVYSAEGQQKVSENGYFPISATTANNQLTILELQ